MIKNEVIYVSDTNNRQELEYTAAERAQQQAEEEQQSYTPRPTGQRVIAWILALVLILGVVLYYYWIIRS